MATEQQQPQTILEINGRPFYVKSDEKGNPHLYDIDTNEDVGYWCQKSGTYVMFSPYEQIMNRLKRLNEEDLKNNVKEKETEGTEGTEEEEDDDDSVDDDDSSVEDEDDETKKIENLWSNSVFVKFIILMFIYNMFQKMVQSIYVDFVFAFAFTILYTKMARVVSSEL